MPRKAERSSREFRNLQNMFEELGEGGKKNELLVADDPGNKKFRNFTEMCADKPSTSLDPIANIQTKLCVSRETGGGRGSLSLVEKLYKNA